MEYVALAGPIVGAIIVVIGWWRLNKDATKRDLLNWKRTMLANQVTSVLELCTHITEKLAIVDDLSRLEQANIETEGRSIVRHCNIIDRLANDDSSRLSVRVSKCAMEVSQELWIYQSSLGKGGVIEVNKLLESTLKLDLYANNLADTVFKYIEKP